MSALEKNKEEKGDEGMLRGGAAKSERVLLAWTVNLTKDPKERTEPTWGEDRVQTSTRPHRSYTPVIQNTCRIVLVC